MLLLDVNATGLDQHAREYHCQRLALAATRALLQEAVLTPKPALVDKRGCGAHSDLTLKSMVKSALVLRPHFYEMACISWDVAPSVELRSDLAACGRRAEDAMLEATSGSNAHRGAIWCLGLLLSAVSMQKMRASATSIANSASAMVRLTDPHAPSQTTHGQLIRNTYGFGGARGEAEAGFPHVLEIGMPFLKKRRLTGRPENTCRIDTLMAIMASLNDTCLLYRGGLKALNTAQVGALEVLALDGSATLKGMERLAKLEKDLLEQNASPGGCADLLAATLFIDSLGIMESLGIIESLGITDNLNITDSLNITDGLEIIGSSDIPNRLDIPDRDVTPTPKAAKTKHQTSARAAKICTKEELSAKALSLARQHRIPITEII